MKEIITNQLIGTGIVLSLCGMIVMQLKEFPKQLWNFIKRKFTYNVKIYEYDELFFVLEDWLFENYKGKYRNVEASYRFSKSSTRPTYNNIENTEDKQVKYKQDSDVFYIRYNGKYLFFSKNKEKLENASSLENALFFHFSITSIFGKKIVDNLLKEITKTFNEKTKDLGMNIYTIRWGERLDLASKRNVKPLSKVIINKEKKEHLLKDLREFENSKEWYKDINIQHKRGYLLYGDAGTGKTTISFALAKELGKDIAIINLNSIKDDSMLMNIFSNMPENCVTLIEDIDAAFSGRENKMDTKISFSCLLNCIDGAFCKEGTILIVTTNHIEKLDPALIRAGRLDYKLEIPFAENEEVEEFLKLFYGSDVYIGEEQIKIPMSLVQEMCIRNKKDSHKAIEDIKSYKSKYLATN